MQNTIHIVGQLPEIRHRASGDSPHGSLNLKIGIPMEMGTYLANLSKYGNAFDRAGPEEWDILAFHGHSTRESEAEVLPLEGATITLTQTGDGDSFAKWSVSY